VDTLAVQLIVPLAGSIVDFHHQVHIFAFCEHLFLPNVNTEFSQL
jgi:hypothetical protein